MTTKTDFIKVKKWLTKVFSKEILFESQESKRMGERGSKADQCAWQIYSSDSIRLQMDLPPMLASHFALSLQDKLQWAIEKQIDPDRSCQNQIERNRLYRDSDWPLPSEVIRDSLWINTELLQVVAKRLTKPADMVGCTIREMLAHEAAWIERKKSVVSVCNAMFLGLQRPPENHAHFGFYYGTTSKSSSGLELAFKIGDYFSPFSEEDKCDVDHTWRKRNHELGLEGMLSYNYWTSGGHEDLEEHRFVLDVISDTDFANKLEILRQPEKLAVARQYIHEVIAATNTEHWFSHGHHPDLQEDVQKIIDSLPRKASAKKRREQFDKQKRELGASPKYKLWDSLFPQLANDQPTIGDLIQTIDCVPPKGQEEVYGSLQKWADETFPLLRPHLAAVCTSIPTKQLKQGTASPVLGG